METAIDRVNNLVQKNRQIAIVKLAGEIESLGYKVKYADESLNEKIIDMLCSVNEWDSLETLIKIAIDHLSNKEAIEKRVRAINYIIDYIKADEKESSGSIVDKLVPDGKVEFNGEKNDADN